MTEVDFKYKTHATSGLSWGDIQTCCTRNPKSRDEIEKPARQVWDISPHIIAVMWESTSFFGEEKRKTLPMSQEKYLESSGDMCPSCRSGKLDGYNDDPRIVYCRNCGASWRKELKLIGYSDLKEGRAHADK